MISCIDAFIFDSTQPIPYIYTSLEPFGKQQEQQEQQQEITGDCQVNADSFVT
jgi:hypothetical protein